MAKSTFFIDNVVAVPMLYGHRYKDDMPFYDLLLKMRSSCSQNVSSLETG